MHSARSHGCATTRRATRRGVSEGALQSGSAGAGAARGNAVCGEQAHPGDGPRHASRRFHRGILVTEGPWGKAHCQLGRPKVGLGIYIYSCHAGELFGFVPVARDEQAFSC